MQQKIDYKEELIKRIDQVYHLKIIRLKVKSIN